MNNTQLDNYIKRAITDSKEAVQEQGWCARKSACYSVCHPHPSPISALAVRFQVGLSQWEALAEDGRVWRDREMGVYSPVPPCSGPETVPLWDSSSGRQPCSPRQPRVSLGSGDPFPPLLLPWWVGRVALGASSNHNCSLNLALHSVRNSFLKFSSSELFGNKFCVLLCPWLI